LVFKALCSKTVFSYISEKEVASLFKNGHFKNVQFRKTPGQIYSTFFMWAIIYGNYIVGNRILGNHNVIVAACNNPMHDPRNFYVYNKNEYCVIK
jgi:hypothetical protein